MLLFRYNYLLFNIHILLKIEENDDFYGTKLRTKFQT